jgi:hypothetical protein
MIRRSASCLLIAAALTAGCEMNLKPGAEGLLDAINSGPTPAELVQMAFNEWDASDRYLGTLGLANESFAGEPVYLALFRTNIADVEPAVRSAAARGLGNHGDTEHIPLLVKALADPDRLVRLEAARGLQRLHGGAAIDPLILAMRKPNPRFPNEPGESDPQVRTEAALALGQYDQSRVLQALIAGLDDSDLSVNNACLASLRTLTGQDLGLNTAAWVDWVGRTKEPFAGRSLYMYPVFQRDLRWFEYVPFVPKPRNETPAPPAGLPRG